MKKVLIVEDHPLMIDCYIDALKACFETQSAHWVSETSFQRAIQLLKVERFDYLILDWLIPDCDIRNAGAHLMEIAREKNHSIKIAIVTSLIDAISLYEISRMFKADCVLVKSDISSSELTYAFRTVLSGGTYLSRTALDGVKKISNRDFYIDNYNRSILMLLSRGIRTKSLTAYIPLSMSAIEKRKAVLRDIFSLDAKARDEELVFEARKRKLV